MPAAYGQRLRLRLFLEGIEVPIISANIQAAPNSPMVASLQIPPLPEGTRLFPRTIVHLFFLDDYEVKLPFMASRRGSTGASDSDATQAEREAEHESTEFGKAINELTGAGGIPSGTLLTQYKLLFGGEVIGFVWSKTPHQRSLVLQCMDWSNYWDYAFQNSNTGIFGPGRKVMFSGGATNFFTDFLSSKGMAVTKVLLSGKCSSFPELKGMAAGIISLFEAIGGMYYPTSPNVKRIAGQNLFFSISELRLHLTHMIAAFEKDPTASKLMRRHGWGDLFNRQLGGLGGQTSFRTVVSALSAIIFHEIFPQPCPYLKPGFAGPAGAKKRMKIAQSVTYNYLFSAAEQAIIALNDVKTALDLGEAAEGGEAEFRRIRTSVFNNLKQLLNRTLARPETRRAPPEARTAYSKAVRSITAAATAFTKWRSGAPESEKKKVISPLNDAIDALSGVKKLTVLAPASAGNAPPRLNQQIFRPDIWFGAPPRCNVLFPEDYDSVSYQRMFLQEPTRLLLKTNDEFFGEDFLFDKLYFAPQTGSVKKDQARMQDLLRGDLLDHEIFTGILPVFEKSGEFNVFASKAGFTGWGGTPPDSSGYAQRSANFIYFKYRFNARQMRIGGKFNPYIACGFPGLIIDRYVDLDTIKLQNELRSKNDLPQIKISEALGTNFLGNFTEVSHSVSQQDGSGRTEVNCSYPRQPEESVEFLGKEDADTVRRKVGGGTTRATDVAALTAPKLYSFGPNRGRITNVTDVTSQYISDRLLAESFASTGAPADTRKLPLFTGKLRSKGAPVPLIPVGILTSARELNSNDVKDVTGAVDTLVVFRAFRIEEEVTRYRRESVDRPMEDLLIPGWYDNVWRPNKIGTVYEDFFGTGAITDPQVVSSYVLKGGSAPNEQSAQASDGQALARDGEDPAADSTSDAATQAQQGFDNLQLKEGSSILNAVDFLVLTYSFIRQNRLNVDEFIRSYTWRPIATMSDIFGTSDLEFSSDGEQVLQGIEGFHSRAFGPYNDLFGLVTPEIKSILKIERDSPAAQRADTRLRKYQAVQSYVSALLLSRGILG